MTISPVGRRTDYHGLPLAANGRHGNRATLRGEPMQDDILDDLLRPGLKLVVCGTAAGNRSAQLKAYYAGPGNKFWRIMHEIGLTPERMEPLDWREVDRYDIGFTDMAKAHFGSDSGLPAHAFDPERLNASISRFRPAALAFNGKKAAQMFYRRRAIDYGSQPPIGDTAIWVLPSTSGAASGAWSAEPWRQMAESLRSRL
jgi:TDG/mug DNA glycosylase family protein